MKRLFVLATVLLATSAAHAGDSYSFDIGGRTIHIDKPSDCDSPSCVSVSIPGIYESGPKRGNRARIDRDDDLDNKSKRQTNREPLGPPAATANAPAASRESLQPANGATAAAPAAQPATTASRTPDQPAASTPAAPSAADRTAPVVASAPASTPEQNAPPTSTAAASPLGIWLTEEKEGKIRIEPCGPNLCGYAMKDNEKILINMKPVSDNKWSGRIHDPKSGSNYDSTIALKGPDTLRVQGCAFGGMFCGGQTWSRVN
ncbi:MAG: DUF2147 domain-containing protein [Rhodopseudomonas sp.]|uniref:DUF2147 domain-containing protein n=1 Tax=Rhodopseudomonas sp. TaxID=1078 RepID=UPI00180E9ECB|nr:DUF2147 domain-containing protein [Rhodopseudomonas sp.]NVN86278.1 DUF2147 domain-containing protein [Rhodopseudomonas sp.]